MNANGRTCPTSNQRSKCLLLIIGPMCKSGRQELLQKIVVHAISDITNVSLLVVCVTALCTQADSEQLDGSKSGVNVVAFCPHCVYFGVEVAMLTSSNIGSIQH